MSSHSVSASSNHTTASSQKSTRSVSHLCLHFIRLFLAQYVGATYNFELISDTLSALLNVVNVGDMESEDTGQVNKYALSFDLEGSLVLTQL